MKIDARIAAKNLDRFKVRGQLSLLCGFMLGFVNAKTPDDPAHGAALKKAGKELLNQSF